ncbi:DUF6153 family protein [Herbiconiux sp. A18JL235]|uniref:DUF6153 family protein n=1 Tax=Herbiconiux sp. A18JL235 TaxID=3152363 RepID=A0AB39BM43_9MICO
MTTEGIRDLPSRSEIIHRSLFAIGVVVAVIVGLLAMHTMSSTPSGHGEPSAVAMTTAHHEAEPGANSHVMAHDAASASASASASEGVCSGECSPAHDMVGMVCVLALLLGGLVTLTLLIRDSATTSVIRQLIINRRAIPAAGTSDFRDPPDLTKLSISRT